MINYISISFVPGSAGNFFSRCLALASDRCYCWIDPVVPKLNLSVVEKFTLYQYTQNNPENWVKFERQLRHYAEIYTHHQLPENSLSIWTLHPNYDFFNKKIAGVDDKFYKFYIDPQHNFEWTVLNALYKNSYIDSKWLSAGKRMLNDNDIVKLNLTDIIKSSDSLLKTVQIVCNTVGVDITNVHKNKIKELWNQWILTTLPESKFQDFKNQIGYYNT